MSPGCPFRGGELTSRLLGMGLRRDPAPAHTSQGDASQRERRGSFSLFRHSPPLSQNLPGDGPAAQPPPPGAVLPASQGTTQEHPHGTADPQPLSQPAAARGRVVQACSLPHFPLQVRSEEAWMTWTGGRRLLSDGRALDAGARGAGASNEVLTPNAPLTAPGGHTGAQGVHLIRSTPDFACYLLVCNFLSLKNL